MDDMEIKEITDFSKARKNPYAERIRKYGYTTRVRHDNGDIVETYYSPEDIAESIRRNIEAMEEKLRQDDLDPADRRIFERYIEANSAVTIDN